MDGSGKKELVEIVWQSSDPDFAQLLNRVREGQKTDESVKVYLKGYLC